MRTSIFLAVSLIVASAASAAMFNTSPLTVTSGDGPEEGRASYSLYYHEGLSGYATTWAFLNGAEWYPATYFDPLDNLGDDIHEAYEVHRVGCGWYSNVGSDVDSEMYICADDGGDPDFGSPLATIGITIGHTDPYWAVMYTTVDPAVQFSCGYMFWVVYEAPNFDEYEIRHSADPSDTDPQFHSYVSTDFGATWEMQNFDWKHTAYARSADSTNNVTPASFGEIKARYE